MDFKTFGRINRERCEAANGFNMQLDAWTLSDWMTAVAGELGEAANIIKKLNRHRDGIPGNDTPVEVLKEKLAHELADVYGYLDLLAQAAGVDLEAASLEKFDIVSERIGYPLRLLGE